MSKQVSALLRSARSMLKVLDMRMTDVENKLGLIASENQQFFYRADSGVIQIETDAAFVAEYLLCSNLVESTASTALLRNMFFSFPSAYQVSPYKVAIVDTGAGRTLTMSREGLSEVAGGAVPQAVLQPVEQMGGFDYCYQFPANFLIPRGDVIRISNNISESTNAANGDFVLVGYKVFGA